MVDRHERASQTSPRAAGLSSHARTTDLVCELVRRAGAKLEPFTEETGQPLDWARPGSLKVARRTEDVPVVQGDLERGRRLGLDVELLSGDEAHALNPLLQPEGVLAVPRVGEDLYFDPSHVAIAVGLDAADAAVRDVDARDGTIRTPVVDDAAGAWTRAASGSRWCRRATSCS